MRTSKSDPRKKMLADYMKENIEKYGQVDINNEVKIKCKFDSLVDLHRMADKVATEKGLKSQYLHGTKSFIKK
jgi:hypothetical protein